MTGEGTHVNGLFSCRWSGSFVEGALRVACSAERKGRSGGERWTFREVGASTWVLLVVLVLGFVVVVGGSTTTSIQGVVSCTGFDVVPWALAALGIVGGVRITLPRRDTVIQRVAVERALGAAAAILGVHLLRAFELISVGATAC